MKKNGILMENEKQANHIVAKVMRITFLIFIVVYLLMEKSVQATRAGMENIEKANESATVITASNAELVKQIQTIDVTADVIQKKTEEVAEGMSRISENTQANTVAIEQVTAATQENTAGTESLSELVVKVKELLEKLKTLEDQIIEILK